MKISDLKKSIKEMIIAELSEDAKGAVELPANTSPTVIRRYTDQNIDVELVKEQNPLTDRLNELEKEEKSLMNKLNKISQLKKEVESSLGLNKTPVNEAPVYDVTDMEGFNKAYDEFKENPPIKSKSLDLILSKLKNDGTVDTSALSKEKGVDSATFNNPAIRKYISEPGGEFTDYLTKKDKRQTDPSEKAAKRSEEEKAKEAKRAEKEKERAEKEKEKEKARAEKERAKAPAQKPTSPEYKKTTTMVDMSSEPSDKDITKTEKELGIDVPKVTKPSKLSAEDEAKFNVALKGITAKVNRIKNKEAKPDDLALLKKAYNDEGIKKLFKKAGKNLDDLVAGIITTKKDKFDDIESDEL